MTAPRVSVFARNRNGHGGRNVGVTVCGINVMVESTDEATDDKALAIAKYVATFPDVRERIPTFCDYFIDTAGCVWERSKTGQ